MNGETHLDQISNLIEISPDVHFPDLMGIFVNHCNRHNVILPRNLPSIALKKETPRPEDGGSWFIPDFHWVMRNDDDNDKQSDPGSGHRGKFPS